MNHWKRIRIPVLALAGTLALGGAAELSAQAGSAARLIEQALGAAPPSVAEEATVRAWDGDVLRRGSNGWTCYPDMGPDVIAAMCLDRTWVSWMSAYMERGTPSIDRVGIGYMLRGDSGSSNTDPFAEGPTADNDWVVAGPHLMIIVPDARLLEGIPTDPAHGGPWVMWKGTPWAHIMMSVAEHPPR
jgi:hypothetical protein